MRAPLVRAILTIAMAIASGAAPVAAQSPVPKAPPKLPPPASIADTVMVSSLALANGATFATAPLTLNHVLIGGLRPTQFRASKFADFRDVTWKAYSGAVPSFGGPSSGVCASAGTVLMVAHFQVRAPRPGVAKSFVHSNVARDTTCLMISG